MIKNILNSIFPKDIYRFYFDELETLLSDSGTVLDLACGKASPLKNCKKSFHSVGVDIFEPYLIESKNKGIHDDYIISDVLEIEEKISSNSFDSVIALDLIEHLEKSDGFRLIQIMESIAIKNIIIFTPNGFLRQDAFDSNPWQEHVSGWEINEMENLGFTVKGHGGHKALRGMRSEIKYPPEIFWSRISYLSQRFSFKNSKSSYQLLCYKEVNQNK
mgnify:CR=1 FL=1